MQQLTHQASGIWTWTKAHVAARGQAVPSLIIQSYDIYIYANK